MNERYRVYSTYLKEKYGEKVYKLPISIPDTCPNRDGTLGYKGCVFCGSIGAGYENLPASVSVARQIAANIAHIQPKYKAKKFIAYFQNFTNTYLSPAAFRTFLQAACTDSIWRLFSLLMIGGGHAIRHDVPLSYRSQRLTEARKRRLPAPCTVGRASILRMEKRAVFALLRQPRYRLGGRRTLQGPYT